MSFETLCGRIASSTYQEDSQPTRVYRGGVVLKIRRIEHV
jgi:hypothetical protein